MKNSAILGTLFLATIMLFNSLRVSFTYAYYYMDKEGFIEMLCENTKKPELKCNGKCQLKKVTNDTNNQTETPTVLTSFKEIVLFVENKNNFSLLSCTSTKKHVFYYSNLYKYSNHKRIDQPPQV